MSTWDNAITRDDGLHILITILFEFEYDENGKRPIR